MHRVDEWNSTRGDRVWRPGGAGIGVVRIALLFGFVAVAFALMMVPIAEKRSREWSERIDRAGIDSVETGAIQRRSLHHSRECPAGVTGVCVRPQQW
jgi:hypothetical protein